MARAGNPPLERQPSWHLPFDSPLKTVAGKHTFSPQLRLLLLVLAVSTFFELLLLLPSPFFFPFYFYFYCYYCYCYNDSYTSSNFATIASATKTIASILLQI